MPDGEKLPRTAYTELIIINYQYTFEPEYA